MHPSNHFHRGDLLSYSSKFEIKESYLWLPRKVLYFFFQFFNWEEGKELLFKCPFNCIEVLVNKLDIWPHSEKKLSRLCASLSMERKVKGHRVPFWSCVWSMGVYCMEWPWLGSWLVSKSSPDHSLVSPLCISEDTSLYFGGHVQCHSSVTQCVIYFDICVHLCFGKVFRVPEYLIPSSWGLFPLYFIKNMLCKYLRLLLHVVKLLGIIAGLPACMICFIRVDYLWFFF